MALRVLARLANVDYPNLAIRDHFLGGCHVNPLEWLVDVRVWLGCHACHLVLLPWWCKTNMSHGQSTGAPIQRQGNPGARTAYTALRIMSDCCEDGVGLD